MKLKILTLVTSLVFSSLLQVTKAEEKIDVDIIVNNKATTEEINYSISLAEEALSSGKELFYYLGDDVPSDIVNYLDKNTSFNTAKLKYKDKARKMLGMTYYSQRDPRWKNERLGKSNVTIGSHGCALTSVAMALSAFGYQFSPSDLNKVEGLINREAKIQWNELTKATIFLVNASVVDNFKFYDFKYRKYIMGELMQNHPVVIGMKDKKNGKGMHFVVASGFYANELKSDITIFIYDPGRVYLDLNDFHADYSTLERTVTISKR